MKRAVTFWVGSENQEKGSYWVMIAKRAADLAYIGRCSMLCRREFERFTGIRVPAKRAVRLTVRAVD